MKHPALARSIAALLTLRLTSVLWAQAATEPGTPAPVGPAANRDTGSASNSPAHQADLNQPRPRSLPEPGSAPVRPGEQALPQPVALEPAKPGEKISPGQAQIFRTQPLWAPAALRTFFLDFAAKDWEDQLGNLAPIDTTLPARLAVDGSIYPGIGARFLSAVFPPGPGYKRSLSLSLGPTQDIAGLHQLTLLDERTDPTFLRTMLYLRIAREYIPAPAAGFVRTVINGENWGVYTCVQPFDAGFTQEKFASTAGARFVARGGNLAYLGEDPAAYRGTYHLLSDEDPAAWTALIRLCRMLNQTPPAQLEAALAPLLDVDEALKFLALETALINQAGYGSPGGSYGLYLDPAGRFHLVPQEVEASFRLVEVREYDRSGRGGGRRGGGRSSGGEQPQGAGADGSTDRADALIASQAKKKNFPHQTGSDLAMLLSYTLIDRADPDADHQATKDKWVGFARSWFLVMDEDFAGRLNRDQFIAKVRLFVTPPSVIDGRTRQTYGKDDAPARIGQDLFAAIDTNQDGWLTADEFQAAFAGWFDAWNDPKTHRLTEEGLRAGLSSVLTQTVFQADQTYIATAKAPANHDQAAGGGNGGRGGGRRSRGGGGGGEGSGGGDDANVSSSIGVGPLRLGTGGRGGSGDAGRTMVTFGEQLDPLAEMESEAKPLRSRLLAVSALRSRYLEDVRDIAEKWLTWERLGPIARAFHSLIAADVEKDTRKTASYAHFVQDLDQDAAPDARGSDTTASLKAFVAGRHKYLLDYIAGER